MDVVNNEMVVEMGEVISRLKLEVRAGDLLRFVDLAELLGPVPELQEALELSRARLVELLAEPATLAPFRGAPEQHFLGAPVNWLVWLRELGELERALAWLPPGGAAFEATSSAVAEGRTFLEVVATAGEE